MPEKAGRTVFTFNIINENVQGLLLVEIFSSLRINLQLTNDVNLPHTVLFTDAVDLISLDSQRSVTCDV